MSRKTSYQEIKSNTKKSASGLLFWLPLISYVLLYLFLSGSFLTLWPAVHSDEAWLASLSHDMGLSGDFGITESFFDAKPRVAHAIRILFHGLQALFLESFGFRIGSVRLISLLAGGFCLLLLGRIGKQLMGKAGVLLLPILISLDTAFLYASHFARQEILLALSMLFCLFILLKGADPKAPFTASHVLALSVVTGLSVGLHPNSFLLACICGAALLFFFLQKRPFMGRLMLLYIAVTGLIASVFLTVSFSFTPTFLPDYFRYGQEEFQLSSSASGRFAEFVYYFKSIFHQESGTYLLADLRVELLFFLLCGLLLLGALAFLWNTKEDAVILWKNQTLLLFFALLGLTAGMLFIGRYNQTSILFYVLLGWLLVVLFFRLFEGTAPYFAMALLSVFLFGSSFLQICPWLSAPTYDHFLTRLSEALPSDAPVIANLNTAFYFEPGRLFDYRNLPYLEGEDSLSHYIEKNKIQYILYTDELDFIYENRPYYNVIYGNASFIKTLNAYCEEHCQKTAVFENPMYGPRILPLIGDPEYGTVTVYQVLP